MKINFNLWSLGVSGGTRTVFALANGLIDRGHEVVLTALSKGGGSSWFGEIKAEVNAVSLPLKLQVARKLFFSSPWELDWSKVLESAIPECDVNVATYFETVYPTVFSGKGEAFYFIQHFEPCFFPRNSTLYRKALATYDLPLKHLCVSKWLSKKLGGACVGNGVDLSKFKQIPTPTVLPLKVMCVHRGLEWKGKQLILDTINLVKQWWKQTPQGFLDVCVVEPNNASDRRMAFLYNVSDVLLFPSYGEGFGLVPLEAMACGLPSIVSNCYGIDEYAKHLENCIVVESLSPEALAEAVRLIMFDRELRTRIIKGGFETAQQYDFCKVVDRFEKAIGG